MNVLEVQINDFMLLFIRLDHYLDRWFNCLHIFFIRVVSQSRTWFPERPYHLHITRGKTSLSWAMTALLPNVSVPGSTAVLLPTTEPFNLTAAAQAGLGTGQSLAPLCTLCCCGFLNRTLTVVFMVSLAFAIVVGNVVTLTVFVQTRQSRTPQGYLKGNCCLPSYHYMLVGRRKLFTLETYSNQPSTCKSCINKLMHSAMLINREASFLQKFNTHTENK